MKFLLYGANGYTGKLITRFAADYGLTPILAGRTEAKIKPLAEQYGYEYRIFDLQDTAAVEAALQDIKVVLHAAGPFMFTSEAMINACLKTQTHYLDITGEVDVFEAAAAKNEAAKTANIMVMPGVGFDVVPTDCMAAHLKNKMPDATHLKLAFTFIGGGISHGTAMTMAENLGEKSKVRKDGKLVDVHVGHKAMKIPFARKSLFCMTIPWGDISTAFYTTGIPNIETYAGVSPSSYKWVKRSRHFGWLMRTNFVKNMARNKVRNRPAGPTDKERETGFSQIWGEVSNAKGDTKSATIICAEGYTLTAWSSLTIVKKVLEGQAKAGFWTPAGLFGANLILEFKGSERKDI